VGDVEAADIAQLDPFELLPEPLARVELRGIGREPLQMQALGGAIGVVFAGENPDFDLSAPFGPREGEYIGVCSGYV
jgi:hypothetical protein